MLISASNIQVFFRESLSRAQKITGVQMTEHAEAYLVHLLTDFMRSERVFAGIDAGEKVALATLMSRAQESDKEEALRIFKHLGDSSLYFISFFEESKERQHVGTPYYLAMGESAYQSVSSLLRDSSATTAALYGELADQFSEFVSVLKAVSQDQMGSSSPSSEQILGMLERYQSSQDPQLLAQLRGHGVEVNEGSALFAVQGPEKGSIQ